MQRLLVVSTCAIMAVFATQVVAAQPSQNDVLKIDITAQVVGHCGVEAVSPRTNDRARLDQPTTVSFDFEIDCNAPFRIGLATQSGGLKLEGSEASDADVNGFARVKPYDIALRFNTDQAGLVDAGTCTAGSLDPAAGSCPFFGTAAGSGFSPGRLVTAIRKGGTLAISWKGEDSDPVRLAAGDYRDVITVVVGPRT